MRKQIPASWIAVVGLMASTLAVMATPAWSATAAACYVSANSPYQSGSQLYGRANRSGCGDYVQLAAWIMKDRPFSPDQNVGIGRRNLTNGSVT